jgi:amino acid transporter
MEGRVTDASAKLSGHHVRDHELHRNTFRGAPTLLAFAAALQITIAMGSMAHDLGDVQPLIWAFAAAVGLVQCLFIAELAVNFPRRSGGTATYAHEAFGNRNGWLPALSSWAYWFAWIPGVAVNLILAADYLQATIFPHFNTIAISVIIGILLYIMNVYGLLLNIRVSVILVVLAAVPLATLLLAPLARPSLFHGTYVWPLHFPGAHDFPIGSVIKWLFVATWSAYGAEMASTIFAECRTSRRIIIRDMSISGVACLTVFSLVPLAMTGMVGAHGLGSEPTTVFLVPAHAVLGRAGVTITGLMLASALIVGAQAFIISSSRTLYQMSLDGYIPRIFQRVNRFGVPFNTVLCDATVIALLVGIFGTNVINVVASANSGYLLVFIILPLGYVVIRRRSNRIGSVAVMPRWMTPIALVLAVFNAVLLIAGAALWGPQIWLTGVAVLVAIFPLMLVRRLQERRDQRLRAGNSRRIGGSVGHK